MPVYEYQGVHYELPDGLSNEQALTKIKKHVGGQQLDDQFGKLAGAGEAALGVGSGLVAAIPTGFRALSEMAGGASLDEAMERSESTSDLLTYKPRTAKGKEYTEAVGKMFKDAEQDYGRAFSKEQADLAAKAMREGRDPSQYLKAENTERMFGEMAMNLLPIGAAAKAATRGSSPKKPGKGLDTKAYTEALEAGETPSPGGRPLDIDLQRLEQAEKPLYADQRGVVTPELPDPGMQASKAALKGQEEVRLGPGREGPPDGSKPIYVDPQGQAFRGDPREAKAGLALERQAEAADNAMTYGEAPAKGEPLDLLKMEQLRAANEGPQGPMGEAMLQHQFLSELKDQAVANHPFVRAAEQRVTKAEEALLKATHDMKERGKVTASQVARLKRDLDNLEIALEKTRANVSKGIGEGKKPVPFNFRKQGGGVNPAVFDEGFQKTKQVGDYTFEILGRSWGPEVRIYNKTGEDIGGLSTTAVYKGGEQNLTANFVRVLKDEQKKGLAKQAYAFLAETGNDIQKSSTLLADGKKMWNRFEETGFSKDGVIRSPGNRQLGAVKIDPGKEPQGKFLEEHPALKLPTIVPTKWTPEQAIDIASKAKDVDQNALQKIANYGTKGGIYQSLKTDNPIVKFTFEKIHEADSLARGEIQEYIHNKLAPISRDLSRKEASDIWAVVDYHDRSQIPLNMEKLAEMGATPKMLEYVKTHREVMDFAFERLNAARAAADLPPVSKRVAYAAMKSTGDYRQLIYKTVDGEKQIVGVVGSDFKHVVNSRAKALKDQGYEIGEVKYFGGLPRDRGSAQVAFNHVLEILAKEDPRVKEFVDVIDQLGKQEAYNYLNAKKHTMAKKGISGMEGRKDWKSAYDNAKEGMQAQIDYAEQAIKWGHLSEAVQQLRPLLKSEKVQMPVAKKWAEEYISNALGYNPSKGGAALGRGIAAAFEGTGMGYSQVRGAMAVARKTTNTSLLALSPRFWLQNVVQPFMAMPGMKAYLVTKGLDPRFDFGTGYLYIGDAALLMYRARTGKALTAFEADAFSYAKSHHVYGSDLIEHSNSARKGVGYAVDKIGNFVAGSIESGTREMMFFAFSNMLKENGLSVKNGLFEAAHNLTDMAMNNYSAVERPKMYNAMGPIGETAVNLSSYKHNEFSRLALYARQIAEEKSARPLLTQMLTGTALAGLTGMVAFAEADWLVKEVSALLGKPTSLTALAIELSEDVGGMMGYKKGDKQSYALSHGAFSLMGLDMAKSLGLQDAIPNSLPEAAFPGGSKLGEIAMAAGTAAVKPTEMNIKRAAHSMSPPPVAGNMDVEWFSKGDLASNRKNLNALVKRNDTDKMAKRFGFTGINESVQKDKLYQTEWVTQAYQEKRESAMSTIADVFYTLPKGQELMDSPDGRKAVQKYIDNEGDPNSLAADISRIAKKQNMSAQDRAMLEAAASKSITNMYRAQRLRKAFQ